MLSYNISKYYKESTILAIFPSPMMYAGPTEVQWHAKVVSQYITIYYTTKYYNRLQFM